VYLREVRLQYRMRKIDAARHPDGVLERPSDAAAIFRSILGLELVEVCGLLCLSARQHILAYHELSRGTLDQTLVQPRDVFRVALAVNARSVVVGHNHPSGDPTPSADDLAMTQRLVEAGNLVGIELCDHIVVCAEGVYVSLKEMGRL